MITRFALFEGVVPAHDVPAFRAAVLAEVLPPERVEELEETAKLWALAQPKPVPLTEPQIDELRTTFGARW